MNGDDLSPRLRNLRTTFQILKESSFIFSSNVPTFLFLSLLIFSFRTVVENGTHFVTSFIDRDPSLKALLSRLDLAGKHHHDHQSHGLRSPDEPSPATLRRVNRRRPFLHLTRVGTLDDDFFSGDDDEDRSVFGSNRKDSQNASLLIFLNFGSKVVFSDLVVDDGIRFSEVVRSGVGFKAEGRNRDENLTREKDNALGMEHGQELNRVVDLQFFVKGLELGRRDAATLVFIVTFLSAAYGWVILGFLVTYSWALGIVFITVLNDLVGRYSSFVFLVWDGSRLGLKRLGGFILMRWAVRDALTQLLGLWYFGEIEDQYSFFKLFVRLKLMPFSVMSPWIGGYEKEISGYLFAWFFVDTFVAFIFSIDAWIAILDSRKSGREIVKEGCYLISTMLNQAIQIKCLEAVLCGSFVRWFLALFCGRSFAKVFQSTMEVYFMIAWLIFYFVARNKDANSHGRRFGRRELEDLVQGLR